MKPEILEKLQRFIPIRVVLRRHSDGLIEGKTEHSWFMDWDKSRVNIFWSGKAYSIIGEHQLDGISWANENCNPTEGDLITPSEFVADPLAEDCPIEIDWEAWLEAKSKFDKRNAPFKMKSL